MDRHAVLVADQHPELRARLAHQLEADGYLVSRAGSREAVRLMLAGGPFRALILGDFEGPGANAQLLASLRGGELIGEPMALPVLVYAEDSTEIAMLRCYEAGADDFRPKSISYLELRARVRALLRRSVHISQPQIRQVMQLTLNMSARVAFWGTERLPLTPTEFALLAHLASHPERTFDPVELLRDVWGYKATVRSRTVDSHAVRLRRKLKAAGARGWIVCERGQGYRLTCAFDPPQVA